MDHVASNASWPNETGRMAEETDVNPRYPNGIVVAILMVTGLVGNLVVLYIYHFKLQHTVFTTFVTALAALDLTTTLTAMPLDVAIKTLMMAKTQATEAMCKAAHFEAYTSSLASGSILLLIAATRYSKVCQPTRPTWTLHQARLWCLLIVLVAMALCTVSLVTNGMEKVRISLGDNVQHSHWPHNVSLRINETGPSHGDVITMKRPGAGDNVHTDPLQTNDSKPQSSGGQRVAEVYICRTSEEQSGTVLYYMLHGLLMTAYLTISLSLILLHLRISCTLVSFKQRQLHLTSHQDLGNLNHITHSMFRIFFAITLIFLLSYLPHLVCLIVQFLLFRPDQPIPQNVRFFLDLAYNCPYVNIVANPFIYGYMSKRFRSHCLRLLCPCCD